MEGRGRRDCCGFISFMLTILLYLSPHFTLSFEEEIRYNSYIDMEKMLTEIAEENQDIAKMYSIGTSAFGKPIWALELTANISNSEEKPNVRVVSGMHPFAPVGGEIILKLIKVLVFEHRLGMEMEFLESMRIHFLPNMNPDGVCHLEDKSYHCFNTSGRVNGNGVELNRDFPCIWTVRSRPQFHQPETISIMNWGEKIGADFVASAIFQSGELAITYPYDSHHPSSNWNRGEESPTPDEDIFKRLASNYLKYNFRMNYIGCPPKFPKRMINGAKWLPIQGTMMDYDYHYHGCIELTFMINCERYPQASELQRISNENQLGILDFFDNLKNSIMSLTVTSEGKFDPLYGARANVLGERSPIPLPTDGKGRFWRVLPPNQNLYIKVEADDHDGRIVVFETPTKSKYGMKKTVELKLLPKSSTLGGVKPQTTNEKEYTVSERLPYETSSTEELTSLSITSEEESSSFTSLDSFLPDNSLNSPIGKPLVSRIYEFILIESIPLSIVAVLVAIFLLVTKYRSKNIKTIYIDSRKNSEYVINRDTTL